MSLRPRELTRADYEYILGDADKFILDNEEKKATVRAWAISTGISSMQAHAFDAVQLTNLYHEHGPNATTMPQPVQRPAHNSRTVDNAELTRRIVAAMETQNTIGLDALRSVVQASIPTEQTLRELAQQVYDALPPQRLEIVTPTFSHVFNSRVHERTELVLRIASLSHHMMLVGPAGCGKTTIGENVAQALGMQCYITPTVNDTFELTGFIDGHGRYQTRPFRQAFEHGGIWIADEIDAWDAPALLTANSALANGFTTFPDSPTPIRRHANFRMIATANTFGRGADRVYIGRNELDAASLDRFATINVDYDRKLEEQLCNGQPEWLAFIWKMRDRVQEKNIRHVVSTRAIIFGSQAICAGIPREVCEELYVFKGMSKSDREKLQR